MSVQNPNKLIRVTPTISAAIYAAGECMGGLLQVTPAVRIHKASMLYFLRIIDRVGQQAAMHVMLFSGAPAGTFTDQAAIAFAAGDYDLLIDEIPVAATDYLAVIGTTSYIARPSISTPIPVELPGTTLDSGILYVALKLLGTPTYGTTSAITVAMGFSQD